MTIKELKEEIEKTKYEKPDELGKEWYNLAIEFCIKMIEVYDEFKEQTE